MFHIRATEMSTCREVEEDYVGPHLIFTLQGDDNLPAYGCCSYVGRVSPQGGHRGQVVNLGASQCLAVGTVIHEILHAMGKWPGLSVET